MNTSSKLSTHMKNVVFDSADLLITNEQSARKKQWYGHQLGIKIGNGVSF